MLVKVNSEKVELVLDQLSFLSGEYNIHECQFQFSSEYNNLIKKCLFTKDGITYQVDINNNSCTIPYEVLLLDGKIIIGVYAYSIENNNVVLRYSPKPSCFFVKEGSYREYSEEAGALSPSEYDQLMALIESAIEEIQNDYQLKLIPGQGIILDDSNISVDPDVMWRDYIPGRNITIEDLTIGTIADPNSIETIYLNGEKQEPQDKNVDLEIATISVEDINELFR